MIAKISRPRLPPVYGRTRLYRALDRLLGRHPVVWIPGSPGAGKTTLAASYIEARRPSCLWYQMDQGDGDVAAFFHYIGLAAKKATPRRLKPLPRITPEQISDLQVFTRRYFQEIFGRLKRPFVLVFDNYHEVPVHSCLHELIRVALDQIPPEGNAIFLSRGTPPPPLNSLQLNKRMAILKPDELRLSADESYGIARLAKRWRGHEKSVQQLNDYTHGWAAGLVLMLEYSQPGDLSKIPLPEIGRETFFNYFAGEIFDRMDSPTKDFLLKTACPPVITPAIAEELTGIPSAEQILIDINQRHFFTEKRSEPSPVYQYHPLFREFLLFRAEEAFGPQGLMALYRKAGDILVGRGLFEDAVDLYQKAEEWSSMSDLICTHASHILSQGRFRTLEKWLMGIPENMLSTNPHLLYWLGCCRLPFDPAESQTLFARAFERFKAAGDQQGMLQSSCGVVEAVLTEWGDFKQLDPYIKELDGMLREIKTFPSEDAEARAVFSIFAALMFRQPQHPDMKRWADRALKFLRTDLDISRRVLMGGYLSLYLIWMGEIRDAGIVVEIVRELAGGSDLSPLYFATWKMQEAIYDWHTGAFDSCLENIADGLKAGEESGVHLLDNWLLAHGVYPCLCRGDLAQARTLLNKMKPVLKSKRYLDISQYHYLTSMYHQLAGDMDLTLKHGQIARELQREVGTPFPHHLVSITVAQALYAIGEDEKAADLIDRVREAGIAMKSRYLEFLSELTKAHFALGQGAEESVGSGREEQGLESLRKAMRLGKRQGFINFAGWQPSMMARLCVKALEAGIEVEYVQGLVRKRNLIPDAPPLWIENWPWPLKVFTLGRFSLMIDGKPLRFRGKARRKLLELLKTLIALGGREVSQYRLTDLLWPDADGDRASHALETALYRLRKLLVHEKAVQLQDQRLTLDARYCWVDAWALEGLMEKIDAVLSKEDVGLDEISRLTEETLRLYRGAFLMDDTSTPYALSCRERIRDRFLRCISALGSYFCRVRACEQAMTSYRKGLEVDEFAEDFYRGLMKCYGCLGRRGDGVSLYRRCRRILTSGLGVEPSPETEAVYRKLLES